VSQAKIEICIGILRLLAHSGSLELVHIINDADFNCSILKEYLDFLIKQGLVEERAFVGRRVVFVATERGINVLKYFGEYAKMPLSVE